METALIKLLDYDLEESMNKTPSAEEKSQGTMDKLKKASGLASDSDAGGGDDGNVLKIQLAPDSLSFSSSGETKKQNRDMQNKEKEQKQDSMSMEEVPGNNQMLSFDFYVDGSKKIAASTVNTVSPVKVPPISNLSEGYNDVDITPIVEGFKDMARVPHMSHVAFCWGNMYYEGFVRSISTEYTMFTKEGKPVRAKMSINIQLMTIT